MYKLLIHMYLSTGAHVQILVVNRDEAIMLQNLPIILFHNAPNFLNYAPIILPMDRLFPPKNHCSCNKDIGTV